MCRHLQAIWFPVTTTTLQESIPTGRQGRATCARRGALRRLLPRQTFPAAWPEGVAFPQHCTSLSHPHNPQERGPWNCGAATAHEVKGAVPKDCALHSGGLRLVCPLPHGPFPSKNTHAHSPVVASILDTAHVPCCLSKHQHKALQFICKALDLGDSDTVDRSQQLYLKLSEDKSKKTITQIAETRERGARETTTMCHEQLSK